MDRIKFLISVSTDLRPLLAHAVFECPKPPNEGPLPGEHRFRLDQRQSVREISFFGTNWRFAQNARRLRSSPARKSSTNQIPLHDSAP